MSEREPAENGSVAAPSSTSKSGVVYQYREPRPSPAHSMLWPFIQKVVKANSFSTMTAIDLGCGQGVTANMLGELGFTVTGVDPSETGVAIAREAFPQHKFHNGSSDDDLAAAYGSFPLLVSLEVVSFVYDPQLFARRVYELLEPNGVAIISSPYHGYVKNLAISLTDKWDSHLDPFRSITMVKFFSEATYRRLWAEAGFTDIEIVRLGRIPMLAKSMVAVLRKS